MAKRMGSQLTTGVLVLGCMVTAACAVDIEASGDITVGDGPGDTSLAIVSPRPGDALARDDRGRLGALVARVDVVTEAGDAIARVDLELASGAVLGAAGGGDPVIDAELAALGTTTLIAIGRDAGGAEVARASVTVDVVDPDVADCRGWLDLYGLAYDVGPASPGVDDPVTVAVPINGLSYRYADGDRARPSFFMDCGLALSLARAAPMLRARDIIEVVDYGVYNYRCINSEGTPPDCARGMSQHAFARGIDIAGFTAGDGTFYSVNDDWVIDPEGEDTCAAATEGPKDALLHDTICELKNAGVWNIVLTPNYNSIHRNHFHVDLTTGADFIEYGGTVDVGPDHH